MNITVKTGGFNQEQSDVIAIGVLGKPRISIVPRSKL